MADEDHEDFERDDIDLDALERMIAENQEDHIRHRAVKPPRSSVPFSPSLLSSVFIPALEQASESGIVPTGFNLSPAEISSHFGPHATYPDQEVIEIGARRRPIVMQLPLDIWYPRAVQWAQGLSVMNAILASMQ